MRWAAFDPPFSSPADSAFSRFSQSDGGNAAARIFGLEEAPVKLQDSDEGVVKLIDESTKGSHGGKLWRYDGKQQAW